MDFIIFLILFPFLTAAVLTITKNNTIRKAVVYTSAGCIMIGAVLFSVWQLTSFGGQVQPLVWNSHTTHIIDYIMMAIEVLLTVMVICMSIKHKKVFAPILGVSGTALMKPFLGCARRYLSTVIVQMSILVIK